MAKILVVEDEPGIALGLEDSLRLEGHEVEMLGDGLTGGCRASQQDFDLILLDIMLPRKNGFEVCSELRRAGNRTPIILLTARGLESDRVRGLELGANATSSDSGPGGSGLYWIIPATGGKARKLDVGLSTIGLMSVHPDNRHIAISSAGSSTELWVLENTLSSSK